MTIKKVWVDHAIAAAIEASAKIMEVYNRDFHIDIKSDKSPVTEADRASSKIITRILEQTGFMVISEEEKIPAYEDRRHESFLWIVDPLDGTKEFIRKNGEFCICISLIHDNQPIFGLIASPTDEMILMGGGELGVYYFPFNSDTPLKEEYKITSLTFDNPLSVAHSRSHFSIYTEQFIDQLTILHGAPTVIKKGSALKFIDLALSRAHFYPRMAPTMEWDIAAGQAIYEALGGEVLNFTTFEPLHYNKEDLHNPYFIAKNKNLNLIKINE